ncbi:uncharacterized protein LOC120079849 [Benincasa hispida]|uniref:uncharacterized protein LOC120079849 n=1 Tax=Benincasa hispida TaxID=102211 RepID=UPI0018FFBF67|nr:uncharacterized protein LOC120079849 [Benincasa hispida]
MASNDEVLLVFAENISMITTVIGAAFALGFIGWIYQTLIKPPPPRICGLANGPPLTSPRIKLNDGRHLAYRELGVSKEEAQYKIILCHGLDSCKDMDLPISQELMEELKLYLVVYDRAGYCESDPNPTRSVKTEAFDIQELADKLKLGTKFYVIGCSMGTYPIWGCLKYIPHRLLGASLVVPIVNFWWPSLPSALSQHSFEKFPESYKRTFRIAHYTPWLFYCWMTQKWFKILGRQGMFLHSDSTILNRLLKRPEQKKVLQQGEHESLHRDLLCAYGKWEFDPMELTNPFPDNKGSVHMWQGSEDRIVPIELNRFIAQKLPWIQYHELPNYGHLLVHEAQNFEAILRALLDNFIRC